MSSFFARYKTLGIVLLFLSAVIIYVIFKLLNVPQRLHVYQPEDVNAALVDSTIQFVKKYHKIADFELINQNGRTITQDDYTDNIYIADFFFTTCQTICPIMTDHMIEIQERLKNDTLVKLLSHSVIPEYDTPDILKEYALKKGVDSTRWNLVTGSRAHIYELARKSYLAVKDIPGEENAMVHTENFMLIDKKRQIRGFYDGTKAKEIDRLLKEISFLKEEYAPKKSWVEKLF